MKGFIEITDRRDSTPTLINVNHITFVNGGFMILTSIEESIYNDAKGAQSIEIDFEESYEEVKKLISDSLK